MQERLPIINVERMFNQAVSELEEDIRPGSIEGLVIFKTRHKQFQGWIEKYLYAEPYKGRLEKPGSESEADIPEVSPRDVLENMKYVILDDLIHLQSGKTKQISELEDENTI